MKKKSIRSFVGIAFLSMALSACSGMLPGMNQPVGGGTSIDADGNVVDRGASMHTGYGRPTNELGVEGDLYLDLSTYELYLKGPNGWSSTGSLKGSDGKDGQNGKDGKDGKDGQDGQDAQANDSGLVFYSLGNNEYAVGMGTAQFLAGAIEIPNEFEGGRVTQIAENGFKDSNLSSISIPTSIVSIGAHAFENCVNLQNLTLPNSVTTVGEKAFAGCTGLRSVTLTKVNNLGNYAFGNCVNLQSVSLPSNLRLIGEGAFYECSRLSSITYAGTQDQWKAISVGQYWYVGTRVKLITCSDGSFNINIYNEDVMASLDYSYHLVGGFEKNWVPNKENVMTATSIKNIYNLDPKLGSTLSEKDVENLYMRQITIPEKDADWTTKTMYKNKVREVNGNYAVRVSQSSFIPQEDRYQENLFVPDNGNFNGRNRAEALTTNVFIPSYQSEVDENGFSWANLPVLNVRPGTYIFVMAKYANTNTWGNNANYGFGLITVNGGDMIINDPFEEVDPDEPAKAYSATYLNDDGTEFASSSADTLPELAAYSKNIPTKAAEGNTQYVFREWELQDIDHENNVATFKAKFEGCTRGLIFKENAVDQYTGMTKDVVIPSRWNGYDITSISNRAFQSTEIESVSIPDSIVRIDSQAFDSCKQLTSIVIPDSVTQLSDNVFANCSALESVTLSNNLTRLSGSMFNNCTSLVDITLPQRITSIEGSAFYNCTSLTSIVIPDTVTSIGWQAFNNCSKLENVQFSSSLQTISEYAFSYCNSLKSISLPDGLTSIGYYAFQSCRSLTDVSIPDTVTYIGEGAFNNCENLIVRMTSEYKPKDFAASWGGNSIVIYGYVDTVEVDGFTYVLSKREDNKYANLVNFDATGITEFVAPAEVDGYQLTNINLKAFRNNPYIESVDLSNATALTTIGENAFYGCSALKSIKLPDSVTTIGRYAFSNCSSLESISIPNSVTYIEDYAFNNCQSLETVTISDSSKLKEISNYAFQNCSSLRSIVLPDTVTRIGYCAFNSCYSLSSVRLSNGLTRIEDSSFSHCRSLASIVIPDNVTYIGNWAFGDCRSLTSITLGKSLSNFDDNAFPSCDHLFEVVNKSSLLIVPGNTSYGRVALNAKQVIADESQSKLSVDENGFVTYDGGNEIYLVGYQGNDEEIVIPDNVTRICGYAFSNRPIKSVDLGAGVNYIEDLSFENCYYLTSLTYHTNNISINYSAFQNCRSLVERIDKSGLNYYNNYPSNWAPFSYTITDKSDSRIVTDENGFVTCTNGEQVYLLNYIGDDSEIVIPNNVTHINQYAFYNNRSIKSVVIPDNVTNINDSAFYGCDNIQAVYYTGSLEQWRNIYLGSNNPYAFYNNLYCYSADEPQYIGLFWHYVNGVRVIW